MDVLKFGTELGWRVLRKRPPRETAQWARGHLIEMGPTYIKLGQLASTRTDIFKGEVIEELQQLQENVEPMSYHVAKMVMEEEGIVDLDIEEEPIASASIGQVHRVKGRPWVIKIQRPEVQERIRHDLAELDTIATLTSSFMGEFAELLGEWGPMVRKETDYLREAHSMKKFRQLYSEQPIRVPRVVGSYTTRRTLCMEELEGSRLGDLSKSINKDGLAYRLLKMQIVQVVEGGLIHCDPHPGNLAVAENGDIVYYDFGMMARVDASADKLTALLMAVYQRNVDQIIQCIIDLDMVIINSGSSSAALRPYIRFLLSYMDTGETMAEMPDLATLEKERPFRLTSKWSFLFRSFFVIEGICQDISPTQSLRTVIEPYARSMMDEGAMRNDMISAIVQMPMALKALQGSMNESLDTSNTLRTRMNSLESDFSIIRIIVGITFISTVLTHHFM